MENRRSARPALLDDIDGEAMWLRDREREDTTDNPAPQKRRHLVKALHHRQWHVPHWEAGSRYRHADPYVKVLGRQSQRRQVLQHKLCEADIRHFLPIPLP